MRGTPVRRWGEGVRAGAAAARDLWKRLNGGGRSLFAGSSGAAAGLDTAAALPVPSARPQERAARIAAFALDITQLEGRLQEASKAREGRLRKAGLGGRARLAGELRDMDSQVRHLGIMDSGEVCIEHYPSLAGGSGTGCASC